MPDNLTKPVEDLRIRRTFKLLSDALFLLLEEKSFDEISVMDICDRAMVHRTTFYKHFEDKYHLLRFCIQNLRDSFRSASLVAYNEINPRSYYLNIIKQVLHYFTEHKRMLVLLVNQGRSDTVLTMFHDLVSEDIQQKLKEEMNRGVSFRVPVPLITEYHIGALTSLAMWWVKNSMPYSEEKMVEYIDSLMNVKEIMVTEK
jgi:AcrR family transcriptional regulator